MKLGVNIDHVATVRQARLGLSPKPIEAALETIKGGADSIVCHLREDRRHIQDKDVELLKRKITVPLNLEMGLAKDIIEAALRIKPQQVTLVPEKRQELTTEGGLDIIAGESKIKNAIGQFHKRGIAVSLFIDPDIRQILASKKAGAEIIEIHTGQYANTLRITNGRITNLRWKLEFDRIVKSAQYAEKIGLVVAAGHGLDYQNVIKIAKINEIVELNIGHSIISRAIFVGIKNAVREMKELIK